MAPRVTPASTPVNAAPALPSEGVPSDGIAAAPAGALAAAGTIDPVAPPPPVAEPQESAETGGTSPAVPIALGGVLIAGALAGMAMARLRRRALTDYNALYAGDDHSDAGAAPIPAAPAASVQPMVAAPASQARAWQEPVAIPAGPVASRDEREALLRRMVAAQPDASNPFTSHKARRKRARMLLASHDLRRQQSSVQPFDFRTYQPLSHSEPVKAPYRSAPEPVTVS